MSVVDLTSDAMPSAAGTGSKVLNERHGLHEDCKFFAGELPDIILGHLIDEEKSEEHLRRSVDVEDLLCPV